MVRSRWTMVLLYFVVLASGTLLHAQTSPVWTVKPEWVKAHEDFLASDILAGRGSATRDEAITAAYVASEFEGYGLQVAPGMAGFIQTAVVDMPTLDGHAVLQAGALTLNEGTDFLLIASPAVSVAGRLVITHVDAGTATAGLKGAAVLAAGVPGSVNSMQVARMLRRVGAGLALVPQDAAATAIYAMGGGRTATPVRLTGESRPGRGGTVVALTTAAISKVSRLPPDTKVSLAVHEIADSKKRTTSNVIGFLPGSDPRAGTILLTAHLDHLGVGRPVEGDGIFNGANDDASGTTAVLELAHALAAGSPLRRSVLFVCYGSEELGELGSTYFGEHLPVPLNSLVANLEFEMIGNQDPKMPKGVLLLTGWDRSDLGAELKAHGALLGPDPYPEEHFFERSDNYALALKGVVAHTAAGWGTVPTYHQPSDDLQHLDLAFMTAAIQSLIEPVRWLAASDFVPRWAASGRPKER